MCNEKTLLFLRIKGIVSLFELNIDRGERRSCNFEKFTRSNKKQTEVPHSCRTQKQLYALKAAKESPY